MSAGPEGISRRPRSGAGPFLLDRPTAPWFEVSMIDGSSPLLLGSGSPRRRELLATLGIPARAVAVDVDESLRAGELADDYLERVTAAKLAAVAARPEALGCGAILVADTTVVVDSRVLAKPADEADARAMLAALSGREHRVATRFAVSSPDAPAHALHAETVSTRVRFRPLTAEEIAGYAATGEGLDKAGAYAIQGVGAFAVASIEGSYSSVVGLPACEVVQALLGAGLLPCFPLP